MGGRPGGSGVKAIRWGVLSTANIARLVIEANRGSEVTRFAAVASRDVARAQRFAAELGLDASFGSYEALLASDLVDAVYVALPVSMHTEWTVRALQAGKHVLCEKPFATSPSDAARCFDAAEAAGRVVVEGFMWRHHPQTLLARRLVTEGAIGRLSTVRAALSGEVLALFDVGLDLTRRDQLELVGTGGRLTVPDPWVCRAGAVELETGGRTERLPADPDGVWGLSGEKADAYRIELDVVSAAVTAGDPTEFGRTDAVDQAAVLEAVGRSAASGLPVEPSDAD